MTIPELPPLSLDLTSTVDKVAAELRRAIFDGDVASGTPLREIALAESLGVARSTVREALGLLVAEGLAAREPHKGVAVATPDPETVTDVMAVRQVLEGAGVRHWPQASRAAKEAVVEALDTYITAVNAEEGYAVLNAHHLAFHVSLVGLTDSPRLVRQAEAVVSELKVALAQVDRIRRNAHDEADSHARLVELLQADQIEAASSYLRDHLEAARVSILEALEW